MIYKEGKELSSIYFGTKAISAVYYGAKLVWEAITSCFGSGYWINNRPWSNTDSWRNS